MLLDMAGKVFIHIHLFFHLLDTLILRDEYVCVHISHVASTAAGNAGVPVVVDGFFYGLASGMAPRAR